MVLEIQSCSGEAKACVALKEVIGQEVKRERNMGDDVEELLAELEKEKQKNAMLLDRISALEAQIQYEREKGSGKKLKRQKIEPNTAKEHGIINDTRSLHVEKCKDVESTLHSEDTDHDSDDDTEDDTHSYVKTQEYYQNAEMNINVGSKLEQLDEDEAKKKKVKFSNSCSLQKNKLSPPKVAFCPKEIRAILESCALALNNAQSHTIRKILAFASLGIRHGCEDMYELDYNHFTILRKGEPYISPTNPGEHVLYENPGVKKKVFYPNRNKRALCPVQILEEEKTMRPSDATCPSCLFLCIKYGGRTRNIPQNEYVRQRMGRNKLKSFGSLICQMGRLFNIRTGSFFFKALGITLLFMAGFPHNILQGETKCINLDLLHKYYRSDEDAAGEQLFQTIPPSSDLASSALQKPKSKSTTKSKGKKQTKSASKKPPQPQAILTTSMATTMQQQFGLVGYTSTQNPPNAGFEAMSSHTTPRSSSSNIIDSRPNMISYNPHALYAMQIPPRPANAMIPPFMYWPSPHNPYPIPTCPPYHPSYGYRAVSSTNGGRYVPFHPQAYYSHGLGTLVPKPVEGVRDWDDHHLDYALISDSQSSSSSTESK